MANLYDLAYGLEKGLRESEEFKELKDAYEAVMNDENSRRMFDNFREIQIMLQQKQMQGEDITEEEVDQARKSVELVQQHAGITKLMEKEQHLNNVINDLSRIITKPLEELYTQQ